MLFNLLDKKFGKKILFLLVLILPIVLAGCTKTVTEFKAGLVIEKFSPEISTIASRSPIGITLVVKNVGEANAESITASLGGLPGWRISGNQIKNVEPSSLFGSDKQAGFEGEQGIATWSAVAPAVETDQTYTPTVLVSYQYSASTAILIKAVNLDYFKSLSEEEQKKIGSGITISKSSAGPVTVSVKSQQTLISGGAAIPVEIEFKNEGGGNILKPGGDIFGAKTREDKEKLINKVDVEITSNIGFRCKDDLKEDKKNTYEVDLAQGKTGRILCFVELRAFQGTQLFSLDLTAKYNYLIEGRSSIKVSKSLYIPPIFDISVQDSTMTVSHVHGSNTFYILVRAEATNVGNQVVGEKVKLSVTSPNTQSKSSVPSPCIYDVTPQFRTAAISHWCTLTYPETERKIDIIIESGSLKEEQNAANNKLSIPVTVDYDISVESIKSIIKDPKTFSVEIKATVINNGKNVVGRVIPFRIKVDNTPIDHNTCKLDGATVGQVKVLINELAPSAKQEITCTYGNPDKKLEFTIKASVDPSELETDFKLPDDKKNNAKEDKFKINYDLRLSDLSSEVPSDGFNKETGEITYKLSAKVRNVGNVAATEDSSFDFIDKNQKSLCKSGTQFGEIKDLEPDKDTKVGCTTIQKQDEFPVTAVIKGKPGQPDAIVDKQTFTVTSPTKIVPKLEIIPGASRGVLSDFGIGDLSGRFKYNLMTQIKNSETFTAKDIKIEFKDPDGKFSWCSSTIPSLTSGETSKAISCDTTFLPFEKFDAKVIVNSVELGAFKVDSKVKKLAFADIIEPSRSQGISPIVFRVLKEAPGVKVCSVTRTVGNVFQSSKFSKNFLLTKVNVSLEQPPTLGTQLVMKIREDSGGIPGNEILASSSVLSLKESKPDGTSTVINYANFAGKSLEANKIYWIGLEWGCEIPCSGVVCELSCKGDKYGWRYGTSDAYTDGSGIVRVTIEVPPSPRQICEKFSINNEFLPNGGDFGFHVYGIETIENFEMKATNDIITIKNVGEHTIQSLISAAVGATSRSSWFFDNFDDGNFNGWKYLGPVEGWAVENGELTSKIPGSSALSPEGVSLDNFILDAKLKVPGDAATGEVLFRKDSSNFYILKFGNFNGVADEIELSKSQTGSTFTSAGIFTSIEKKTVPSGIELSNENRVRIIASGSSIKLFVNDNLIIDKADETFSSGGFAVSSADSGIAFDDVKINPFIVPGGSANLKIYDKLPTGTHTVSLCTSSMCDSVSITIP